MEVKKLIDRHQVISFDIFDTAILRRVLRPLDIFTLVLSEYESIHGRLGFDYVSSRIEAEASSRTLLSPEIEETCIDKIYDSFEGVEKNILETLKNIELSLEKRAAAKNNFIGEIYQYALNKGKTVIFSSDMYLPEALIKEILSKNGYSDYHRLYLSSEIKLTKSKGTLYDYICSDLDIKPDKILHIGDNLQSDINLASKKGIHAYHYKKVLDSALEDKLFNSKGYAALAQNCLTNQASLYLATLANKYYQLPVRENFWYRFGYSSFGILLYGFIRWVENQARVDGIKKLYFLARDGYVLKQAYELIFQNEQDRIPCGYLYSSRRCLMIPAIDESKDMYSNMYRLQKLLFGGSTSNVEQFMELLSLDCSVHESKIKEAGFSSKEDKIKGDNDYHRLSELFYLLYEDILNVSKRERENVNAYLNKEGFFDHDKIAVVDVGWQGTIQGCLYDLGKLLSRNTEITGYYLGTHAAANEQIKKGMQLKGFITNIDQPPEYAKVLKNGITLFETFHTAPHGSLIKFEKSDDEIIPVFDEDAEQEKLSKIFEMHKGALEFVKDFKEIHKLFDFVEITPEISFASMKKLVEEPDLDDAVEIGNIKFVDGHVKAQKYLAKPPSFIKTLLFPGCYENEYKKTYWKKGFEKRRAFNSLFEAFSKEKILLKEDFGYIKSKFVRNRVKKFLEDNRGKKILFYGAGKFAQEFIDEYKLEELDIIGFIDKNPAKFESYLGKYKIYNPETIDLLLPERVVITMQEPRYAVSYIHHLQIQKNLEFEVIYDLFG